MIHGQPNSEGNSDEDEENFISHMVPSNVAIFCSLQNHS